MITDLGLRQTGEIAQGESLGDLLADALALIHDLRRRVEVLERQAEALDAEVAAKAGAKREAGA